jgi:acetyl-CoA C-acetyltransferase
MKRIAIVGFAQTRHGYHPEENLRDMVFDVTRRVLDEVGIEREEIGTVVTASSDYWQGVSCSNSFYFEAAGAFLKNSPKAAEDGALAFIYAYMRVLSGHHKTALVVAVTKGSEIPSYHTLTNLYGDPFYQRPIGLEDVSSSALQAMLYMNRYGLNEEDLARVVCKNLNNAIDNPNAHRKGPVSMDDVISSDVVAYPLRKMHIAGPSDGACALILADEDIARDLTDTPVWVKGVGWSVDAVYLGDRDLLAGALPDAAKRAYRMAGIKDPSREIQVFEICESTAFQEILFYEGLGLCGEGDGKRLIEEGMTFREGGIAVNPSGGVLSTNPYCARGLIRVGEVALQVMGKAGRHQVLGVEKGLAHSTHGLGGQLHSVIILGR